FRCSWGKLLFRRRKLDARRADALELGLRFAQLGEYLERLRRLCGIDAAHGKSDVDQHPVADTGIDGMALVDDAADVDLPADAADVDGRDHVVGIIYPDDAAWNAETHGSTLPFALALALMRRAAPIAAWPSDSPPSLAGTSACASTTNPASPSCAATLSNRMRFWKQPPDRATVSKRGLPVSRCASLIVISTSAC